jgi:hypothetical protein
MLCPSHPHWLDHSLWHFIWNLFLRWGVVSPTPNPQTWRPSLVGCLRLQLSIGPRREQIFPVIPLMRVRNPLPSNGRCLHYLATALHATVSWSLAVRTSNLLSSIVAHLRYPPTLSWNGGVHVPAPGSHSVPHESNPHSIYLRTLLIITSHQGRI